MLFWQKLLKLKGRLKSQSLPKSEGFLFRQLVQTSTP